MDSQHNSDGSSGTRQQQVVVMGVSGSGKSTVGALLAEALGTEFVEGDTLHPPENVAKMRAGTPLTDADREGWLHTIAARLAAAHAAGQGLVISCSALKRAYRDTLRASAPDLRLIHLHGDFDLLAARMAARSGHYMPASLLA
ncbi:MAG TPA: gluconokinase, partial [Burkholderiaceae bacterium]|nr:gluconokinase [Burkholderiaceae bacterium]